MTTIDAASGRAAPGPKSLAARHVRKLFCILPLCLARLALAGSPLDQQIALDIPAGTPLDEAVLEWSAATKVQVMMSSETVSHEHTQGIKGSVQARAALATLLEGTGLQYTVVGDTVQVIPAPKAMHSGLLTHAEATTLNTAAGDSASSAQSEEIGEVVVTAQKRSELLKDVPVPVSVVSANTLAETNQVALRNFYTELPSFSLSPVGLGDEEMITIRGISTGFNTNPTVGVMVDGVPFGSSTFLAGNAIPDLDPASLARIEVLRGPQGTLYGASSMGGLINYVTVDPKTDRFSGYLQAGGSHVSNGADLGYGVRGAANIPITDTLAVRISAFARRDPGYIDNPFTHQYGLNSADAYGGHMSALWTLNDSWSVKLSALFQEIKGAGSNDVDVLPGLQGLQQSYIPQLGRFARKAQAYSLTVKGNAGPVEITSVSGYSIIENHDTLDFTYRLGPLAQTYFGVNGAAIFTDFRTNKFTEELRAATPLGSHFDLLLGGFYNHEKSPFNQDLPALDPASGVKVGDIGNIPVPSTYEEYAAFGDLTYKITEKFDVQIGARESHIHQTDGQATETGPLFGGQSVNPALESTATTFTYLLTPRLKISPDLMVYARVASGYRAGAPNSFNPDPAVPRQYAPDKTYNYELGAKGDVLDHKLTFDASVYYIDWRDLQLNLLDVNNDLTYGTNGSRAKSEGAELDIGWNPLRGLKLSAWVAYDDAVLTDNFPVNSTLHGADGDRLPFSSRWSGSFSATQDFPITGNLTGYAGLAVSYTGERIGTFLATPQRQIYPAFTRTDLRAGVKYDLWSVDLFANNVADRRALLGGGPGNFPPYAYTVLQPRLVGFNVSRQF